MKINKVFIKSAGKKLSSPYKILGIREYSPMSVVKGAYNVLSMKYHPDMNGDTEENRREFMKITQAYNQIKSEVKKIYTALEISIHSSLDEFEVACKSKMEKLHHLVQNGDEAAIKLHESLKHYYYETRHLSEANNDATEEW